MQDEVERKKFRRLAATLNFMSLDRSDEATRREGNMHEDGESSTQELEETEEGIQISERSRRKLRGRCGMRAQRSMTLTKRTVRTMLACDDRLGEWATTEFERKLEAFERAANWTAIEAGAL